MWKANPFEGTTLPPSACFTDEISAWKLTNGNMVVSCQDSPDPLRIEVRQGEALRAVIFVTADELQYTPGLMKWLGAMSVDFETAPPQGLVLATGRDIGRAGPDLKARSTSVLWYPSQRACASSAAAWSEQQKQETQQRRESAAYIDDYRKGEKR